VRGTERGRESGKAGTQMGGDEQVKKGIPQWQRASGA
jgi:hypothetical protein